MVLLNSLISLAQQHIGADIKGPEHLQGDGSMRQIYRFRKNSNSWIGVISSNFVENQAFIFLSEHLKKCGIPVPEIYAADLEHGCYLLEDLGNLSLADLLSEWNNPDAVHTSLILQAYQKVLYWLPRIQVEAQQGLDYKFCYREKELNVAVFEWDINYFKEYFWKLFAVDYLLTDSIEDELSQLICLLDRVERKALVLRDFQSRNIMWKRDEPYFIDYQMGCRGPIHYDLASLLYASRSGLNDALRPLLIEAYLMELKPWIQMSQNQFLNDFYNFVLIRRLRSLGSYGFLSSQNQKLYFLDAVPTTIMEIHDLFDNQPSLRQYKNLKELFYKWREDENLSNTSSLYAKIKASCE
ncbi:MAG: phosphotransferase [SAR324 cluster bacterium]|nr:phosphotransferase [SAR324 cluster bacterium]